MRTELFGYFEGFGQSCGSWRCDVIRQAYLKTFFCWNISAFMSVTIVGLTQSELCPLLEIIQLDVGVWLFLHQWVVHLKSDELKSRQASHATIHSENSRLIYHTKVAPTSQFQSSSNSIPWNRSNDRLAQKHPCGSSSSDPVAWEDAPHWPLATHITHIQIVSGARCFPIRPKQSLQVLS